MENVLITGVSSGIGRGITRKLIDQGYKVFGSVRSVEKADELQIDFGDNFRPLLFDITKEDEVDAAAEKLSKLLSGQKLMALINNAGTAELGPMLHVPIEDFRRHLEVLAVGQLYVIQKFFNFLLPEDPALKAGRIFNISSISGEGSNYMFGSYAAGKHALEGISKTLREELKLFGIDVIVIAPGNIDTSIWEKQTSGIINKYKETIYYPILKQTLQNISDGVVRSSLKVDDFAEAFYGIFTKEKPAARYTILKAEKSKNPFQTKKVRIIEA